jgi:alcohol oxidase
LVIERGPNNEMPTIEHPICFLSHLMPDSKTVDFNASKPSPNVGGRPLIVPAGSVLGGGSSVNFMMYSRAQGRDFDAWDTPGWSAREMLPFLKKSETYHGEDKKDVHGHDGPVHVSRGTFASSSLEDDCIAAAEKVGIPEVQDLSDLESVNAIHRAKRFVSADGKRQDAATCYLHPRLRDGKHSNLHVLVETQVSRVLFDEEKKRATGIEFRPNPKFHRNATSEPSHSIKARKLVILSSGTCATPSILERSGVGEAKVLEHAGVPVILDLPGVGNGYEDHHLIAYPYLNNLAAEETLDAFVFGRMGNSEDIIKSQHKILGWNAQDVQAKVRPTEAEVDALGPEFREAWDKEYKEHPGKPMAIFAPISGLV